jgi:hypothetical protein
MYRSMFSWTLHWLQVNSQLHTPATGPPGLEPPAPLDRRLGGPPELVWMTLRSGYSYLYWDSNSDMLAVQHVKSRYTDCAVPVLESLW